MARQDYMTIAVPKSVQEIFRKFVAIKELTVKEALSDMLEMYMLAEDPELYLELKKKRLHVEESRNMIADRKSKVSRNNSLFMKLGTIRTRNGEEIGGRGTMAAYMRNCAGNGYTWYGTNSLTNGMNTEKAREYNALAQAGFLKIYFAMNQEGVENEIAYSADVAEICSSSQPAKAPCEAYEYPEEWTGCERNIWIKIRNLKEETEVLAEDFIIASTGNNLKEVIQKGQYIFGYIRRR